MGPVCAEGKPNPCPRHPAFSPRGDRIAFALGGQIASMDTSGSNLETLTLPGIDFATRPAWSPDAERLVFEAVAAGERNLYTVRLDGTTLTQLTNGGGTQPAWGSNDRIAFARRKHLYLTSRDGIAVKRLVRGVQPNWAPDSRQLVFVRNGVVRRLRLGTGRALRVTRGREPVWTPDGRHIVFDRGDAGYRAIYRVRPDGERPRLVTAGLAGRRLQVLESDVQPR